ncbi:hypothetical protein [Catellatospora paridis]|uniref:hypothetical protein n=1 Tax=Catellatospora paridis TaxID=1617086 RepID=UPI0012D39545|nr:hypothetical protein [Catellatospora paridis]
MSKSFRKIFLTCQPYARDDLDDDGSRITRIEAESRARASRTLHATADRGT